MLIITSKDESRRGDGVDTRLSPEQAAPNREEANPSVWARVKAFKLLLYERVPPAAEKMKLHKSLSGYIYNSKAPYTSLPSCVFN